MMRTETALFLVFVALWGGIWAGAFGGQLCGPPPHNQGAENGDREKNVAHAEKDVSEATRTVAVLVTPPSEKAGGQKEAADKNGYCSAYFTGIDLLNVKITDLLIALFTYLLFIKTAGLYGATRGLQRASIKQSVDMKNPLRRHPVPLGQWKASRNLLAKTLSLQRILSSGKKCTPQSNCAPMFFL
jgi:hypothetical protein